MGQYLEQLRAEKLLPLYTVNDLALLPYAEAVLLDSGLHFIEVTYRSRYAGQAIKQLAESGELIVGAGTVRDLEVAKDAIKNGAQFIVMPGLDEEVIKYCQAEGVEVFPGAVTPTEIMKARNLGLSTVKFFPANIYGGLAAIKALSGPFFDMSFIPTGGVDADNFTAFLAHPAIAAVGGSFILSEQAVSVDKGQQAKAALASLLAKLA